MSESPWLIAALWVGLALLATLVSIRTAISGALKAGNRVSEPESKFILLTLFALGGLGNIARSEAVLPAYLVGMVLAPYFLKDRVLVGHEVKTIVEFIQERGFDLLVIGFMGHSRLYDRVMGSTCQGLVRLAPCAVLVVK